MKFGEVMTLLESLDRVRIMQDGKEIYNQFFDIYLYCVHTIIF